MKSELQQNYQPSVLVVEDDQHTRDFLRAKLGESGLPVVAAESAGAAMRAIESPLSVVLLDLNLPDSTGFQCLADFKRIRPELPVIILSASKQTQDVAKAMALGAFWYLEKKSGFPEILALIHQADKHAQLMRERSALSQSGLSTSGSPAVFVKASSTTAELYAHASRIAPSRTPVLITGESGTGKSLLAHHIHDLSGKRGAPFLVVNCAGTPRPILEEELFGTNSATAKPIRLGKVEIAKAGTLLLDEIGDLPLELQPRLLPLLEAGRTDIPRIIATTNQDLPQKCADGTFRSDLYYRLAALSLDLQPLRLRSDDILEMVSQRISKDTEQNRHDRRLSPKAQARLLAYRWPGNVRELENTLERALTLGESPVIEESDLGLTSYSITPPHTSALAGMTLEEIERRAVKETLEACGGNRAMAARTLGISERSIYNKIPRG